MKLGLISVDGAPTLIAALDDGLAGSQNDWSAITVRDLLAGSELAPPAGMIDLINGADRFLPALQVALDRSRSDAVGRSIEEDQSTIGEVRSMYADDRPTIGDAQSPYGDDRRTIGEVRSTNADDQSIIGEVQSTYRDDQHTIGEVKRMYARDRRTIGVVDLKAADWLPPQPDPRKILGVAFNNRRIRNDVHVDPGVPNFFLKSASCLIGHRQSVIIRSNYGNTIPEPELCVIIGKQAKDVAPANALEHVFGYSILDDITSHGMKFSMDSVATTRAPELMRPEYLAWRRPRSEDDTDLFFVYHTRSKNCDTFGPMGPWITTRDEIGDPGNMRLRAWCDGELFSDDTTARYTFSVAELIAEASKFFTLEPGDIISCGTAAKGTEKFKHAHRSVLLQERECRIDIELEGLGTLTHFVRHEP